MLHTTSQRVGSSAEHAVGLGGTLGGHAAELHHIDHALSEHAAHARVLDLRQRVATLQGLVPAHALTVLLGMSRHVEGGHHLEASLHQGLIHNVGSGQVGQRVTVLDVVLDLVVLGVGGIVLVGHDPVETSEQRTGLQRLVDLSKARRLVRGVARRLHGVRRVDGLGCEGQVHEVALLGAAQVLQAASLVQDVGALDLVRVVVDTDDLGAGEASDLTVMNSCLLYTSPSPRD